MDFLDYISRQKSWSYQTFGEGFRTMGIASHIVTELLEVMDDMLKGEFESAKEEWIDVVILGLDGAYRMGMTPQEIADLLESKQVKNLNRRWPRLEEHQSNQHISPYKPTRWQMGVSEWACLRQWRNYTETWRK